MKKIISLILGVIVATAAVCQTTLPPEVLHVHGSPVAEPSLLLLKLKWNKVIDESIFTGHDAVYQPESDQGSNAQGTKIRILAAHIAGNAEVTAGDIALLEAFIAEIVKPGTYVPPTGGGPTPVVLREHVNDQGSTIVYDPGWQKIIPNPAAQWLDKFFQKDATLITVTNVWASYPFRGRKIELIGEKCDNHGKARVEILKGTTVIKSEVVDMYKETFDAAGNPATLTNWCPAGVVAPLFTSEDLPLDNYVIRWKFESNDLTKVPRRDSMVIDGLKIYE